MKMTCINYSAILLLIFSLTYISCTTKKSPAEHDSTGKNISLIMGNPINYGTDNLLIFPVGGNYNPEITGNIKTDSRGSTEEVSLKDNGAFFSLNAMKRYDDAATNEYTNSNEEAFDIRNLLFYNQLTRKSYLLALQNLHILSFSIHNEFANPLIFYRVVKKDINNDKKFNSSDAVMFCVSDINGKNLVEVTPPDEQFLEYFYYSKNQTILIKSSFDIDKDRRFTLADETNFREMKLALPSPGREIFTKSLKDSIKSILK